MSSSLTRWHLLKNGCREGKRGPPNEAGALGILDRWGWLQRQINGCGDTVEFSWKMPVSLKGGTETTVLGGMLVHAGVRARKLNAHQALLDDALLRTCWRFFGWMGYVIT
jgi:hypothetical protein